MEENGRLRRKDTTKGPPLRILSLDGGGVRGYSMLILLQELMHRTFVEMEGRAPERHEIPKPCDHFDLIAGTGTGGLIAIMLGRLRLDLDTCKDVYVHMTRRVFETDKTLLGIPLKGTMFKASKLEESIRECVARHTVSEFEGNDTIANAVPMTPDTPRSAAASITSIPQRSMSQSSRYSQIGMSPMTGRFSFGPLPLGNPNALLYDTRETRTKTAVTAVLKGTPVTTLLRSYDSRREPAPDVNCTIWQAGRATAATAMAFKSIQVGQSVYHDEGPGRYNPAPQILDEAVQNEWPGREVGVFVSIGTGKRPGGTGSRKHEWYEGFLGGTVGDFAEARRRLIEKVEACEDVHRYMLREYLTARGVNVDNYYRLNVEVGVGEFGMNEWSRLSDISTNTRVYLSKADVQNLNNSAAAKLARVHFAKIRHDRAEMRRQAGTDGPQYNRSEWEQNPWERPANTMPPPPAPPSVPDAVELPGDEDFRPSSQYEHRPPITDQKYSITSDSRYSPNSTTQDQKFFTSGNAYDQPWQNSSYQQYPPPRPSGSIHDHSPRPSEDISKQRTSPPPLPPKTPVSAVGTAGLPYPEQLSPSGRHSSGASTPTTFMHMGELGRRLPYPDMEGPPPPVNTANKPQIL